MDMCVSSFLFPTPKAALGMVPSRGFPYLLRVSPRLFGCYGDPVFSLLLSVDFPVGSKRGKRESLLLFVLEKVLSQMSLAQRAAVFLLLVSCVEVRSGFLFLFCASRLQWSFRLALVQPLQRCPPLTGRGKRLFFSLMIHTETS